ncbi:MAG: hypothetical protein Q9183_006939, partial [Haloplaca sp. 2 TL-2023]
SCDDTGLSSNIRRVKMDSEDPPSKEPGLPWRIGSAAIMGFVGSASRLFMFGANSTEVHGLDSFLETLDRRKDPEQRERGLITGTHNCCSI